jgi:hypothetical protein
MFLVDTTGSGHGFLESVSGSSGPVAKVTVKEHPVGWTSTAQSTSKVGGFRYAHPPYRFHFPGDASPIHDR